MMLNGINVLLALLSIGKRCCLRTLSIILSLLFFVEASAKRVICDTEVQHIESMFTYERCRYVIKKNHILQDKITIPPDCEICFEGGSLSGSIKFTNTLLSGRVKLHGSNLDGHVNNKVFRSEWLCYGDGLHDDAHNVNQMIDVCGKVHFCNGVYLMKTMHRAPKVDKVVSDDWQPFSHIGISMSNVELKGIDPGVVFLSEKPSCMICIYSVPYKFEETVKNINIDNITFRCLNEGKEILQLKHTIKVLGVNGLRIKNCIFDDFWGDAICLHSYGDMPSTGERTRNSNVIIKNNHIKGGPHYKTRNGVAVVNGVNVRIEDNIIEQTSGEGMPGAIDVEANSHAFSVDNIVIKDNIIKNCKGTAGGICINSKGFQAPAHNIMIIGNHISGCTSGLAFVVQTENTTWNYVVKRNVIEADTPPYQFVGEGKSKDWLFKNNVFKKGASTRIPGKIQVKRLIDKCNIFGKN